MINKASLAVGAIGIILAVVSLYYTFQCKGDYEESHTELTKACSTFRDDVLRVVENNLPPAESKEFKVSINKEFKKYTNVSCESDPTRFGPGTSAESDPRGCL